MTATAAPKQQGSPLGTAIRTLRLTADLTIADASKIAGISPAYLSRVENGLASPSPAWVSIVAEAIGQHLDEHSSSSAA